MKFKNNPQLKYCGLRILILDGNCAQCLPLIKHFGKLGCHVTVLCESKLDPGYATRYSHRRIIFKSDYSDVQEMTKMLLCLVKNGHYDIVFPLNDFYAYILSKNKARFCEFTNPYVNDWEVFVKAYDKSKTMEICTNNNIPCPASFKFDDLIMSRTIQFPLVIKPVSSNGAKGFSVVNDLIELKTNYAETTKRFGPTLIQEFISQTKRQFQVETLIDKNGQCKLFVLMDKVRWYPLNGGSSTLNITLHNTEIKNECVRLLTLIGWRGYASLDLIEDPSDGKFKIMEINPRMNGTCKICFSSGVDLASSLIEDALDNDVQFRLGYADDIRLRVFFKDFLWFIKSKDRFKSKPSWFSFKKTVDEFISLDDPRVGIRYFFSCFKRLKKDKKNRI